jgi:hypothetical protein
VRGTRYTDGARLLAGDTMRVARENLKRIADRLANAGYRFANARGPLIPPSRAVVDELRHLESIAGPIPLSIGAAIQYLGAVDLTGDHPEWPKTANVTVRPARSQRQVWLTDPFVFAPLPLLLNDALDHQPVGTPFALAFAGDPLTKAGYSGGAYSVQVPCLTADPLVLGDAKRRRFVELLRVALRFGGFAGFARIPGRPEGFIRQLVAGLPAI